MYSAAPQMPEGRRPVCIQSLFMLATSRSAVLVTSANFSRTPRRSAKRCRYRLGSTGLPRAHLPSISTAPLQQQQKHGQRKQLDKCPIPHGSGCTISVIPCEHGLLLEAQQFAQLQEHIAQHEDIDLERVREVDEHEGLGVLPAHDIQAGSGYLCTAGQPEQRLPSAGMCRQVPTNWI